MALWNTRHSVEANATAKFYCYIAPLLTDYRFGLRSRCDDGVVLGDSKDGRTPVINLYRHLPPTNRFIVYFFISSISLFCQILGFYIFKYQFYHVCFGLITLKLQVKQKLAEHLVTLLICATSTLVVTWFRE